MSPVIITPPPAPPPVDPGSTAPPTLTVTYYRQLAAHFLAALDEIAAIIPRLEETLVDRTGKASSHVNIPLAFLATAIDSTEQLPELQVNKQLDVDRGRDTMQLMEAFRPIRDKVTAFDRDLGNVLDSRQSSLAVEALDTYAVAKVLARDRSNPALLACVDNLQRDLGRRGPKKKKPVPAPGPDPATPTPTPTPTAPRVGKG